MRWRRAREQRGAQKRSGARLRGRDAAVKATAKAGGGLRELRQKLAAAVERQPAPDAILAVRRREGPEERRISAQAVDPSPLEAPARGRCGNEEG
jgi:hypothetical protein